MDKLSVNEVFGELVGQLSTESVLLAGGYVRDCALEKPVKDADFFVKSAYLGGRRLRALKDTGWKRMSAHTYRAAQIHSVWENTERCETPLNLIITTVPEKQFVLNNFDWGLCKCWMDYHGKVEFSEHFVSDLNRKVHTWKYDDALHIPYTVLEHLKRLKVKYPWPSEVVT